MGWYWKTQTKSKIFECHAFHVLVYLIVGWGKPSSRDRISVVGFSLSWSLSLSTPSRNFIEGKIEKGLAQVVALINIKSWREEKKKDCKIHMHNDEKFLDTAWVLRGRAHVVPEQSIRAV